MSMSAVEWKKLGEVANYYRGVTYNKRQEVELNTGGTKILRANNISLETNRLNFDDIKEISQDVSIKDYQWLDVDDILICAGSGSKEHVGKVAFIEDKIGYAYGGFMGKIVVIAGLLPRYLYHIISGSLFKKYLDVSLNSTTINNLNSEIVNNFLIPIPSLAKQQEIVSHLDTFTSLISNLESELDMRRKQYEHYRNQLLDFEGVEGVEWKTLGEVGEFVRGNGIQKKDFVEDGYGCIHYGQVYTQFDLLAYETITGIEKSLYDKCRKAKCGDIVLATTSENLEDVAKPVIWLGEEEIAVSGDAFIYKHNQNPIFIGSQFLTDRFSKFKGMNAKGAKVIRITGDSMAEYKIALPSLEKQNEIAEGIKSFENLIQSLEQEIKLRKQQYEYYREKLLTFE